MNAGAEFALVLLCASLGAAATWAITGSPSREVACDPAAILPDEICLATLQSEWPDGSYLWIDARPAAEWQADGLKGSISLTTVSETPFDEQVEASLDQLGSASRAVVYCGSSSCGVSKEVTARLRALGFIPEVRALHGGWDALKQAGLAGGD